MSVQNQSPAQAAKPFATGSIRVLVVDDDEGTRDYLCELLGQAGCEVTAVASGEEAIQKYRCERYSVAIIDIFMPGKDGFDTIMDIRRSFPQARLIAISGRVEHQGLDVISWAGKIGAQRVLKKPFTPDELLYAMAEVLQ
jgi:CheY-like chemotaxis protein